MATNSAEGIRWNLSDLFASYDDPQIEATLKNCRRCAEAFAERFRSPMERPNTLTVRILLQALNDLETIYQLGHGLHGCLSRKQNYFNYDTPLTTAETASVFGEMLVFDRLLARQTDPQAQIALLAGKIEDIFATVFRQNALTRFEELAFSARKEQRLTPETLGSLWLDANGQYYGDAVDMPEGYRWGWSYIPHFIHSRFYCYSYVFGQLLVLALYRMYKDEGKSFVPKYLTLLEAGGSDSPEALLRPLGVNIHDAEFWQKGFEEIKQLVGRLQRLTAAT